MKDDATCDVFIKQINSVLEKTRITPYENRT